MKASAGMVRIGRPRVRARAVALGMRLTHPRDALGEGGGRSGDARRPSPNRLHRLRSAHRVDARRDRRRACEAPSPPCSHPPRLVSSLSHLEFEDRRAHRGAGAPEARADGVHRLRLPLARPLSARQPRRPCGPLRVGPPLLGRRSAGALTASDAQAVGRDVTDLPNHTGSMSLPLLARFGSVHAERLKQQGRRFPLFIFEILTSTRRFRVSGFWVALTQRTHSQRAIGVMAFHRSWIFLGQLPERPQDPVASSAPASL